MISVHICIDFTSPCALCNKIANNDFNLKSPLSGDVFGNMRLYKSSIIEFKSPYSADTVIEIPKIVTLKPIPLSGLPRDPAISLPPSELRTFSGHFSPFNICKL